MLHADATPRGADGEAVPNEAPLNTTVVLGDRLAPAESEDEIDPRDAMEDEAAKRRYEQLEEQAKGNAEAEVPKRPAEDGTPEDQPRDPETGRFLAKQDEQAPVAQQQPRPVEQKPNGPSIRFMVNGQAQEIPADARIVVKVDGQEREITAGEWQKSAQIEAAARKRLSDATAARAEAERLLAQARQPQPAPQPVAQPQPAPQAPEDRTQILADFIKAVTYADEEKAKELGAKLIATPAPQNMLTPEQAIRIADSRLEQRMQRERAEAAFNGVRNQFKEVFSDSRLQAAVAAKMGELMSEDLIQLGADPRVLVTMNPEQIGQYHREAQRRFPGGDMVRSFETILRGAAESTHKDFVAPRKPNTPAPQTTVQSRHEAKRTASAPPAPATARPSPKAPTVKTAAQIYEEEQADRAKGRR